VTRPQGGRPAAIFYPFEHPTPYIFDWRKMGWKKEEEADMGGADTKKAAPLQQAQGRFS
jgi:hypothetical protein